MFTFISCDEKSRYRRPSSSQNQLPSAPATTTGESDPWADQEWKTWARSFVNVVLWAVSRAVMESH